MMTHSLKPMCSAKTQGISQASVVAHMKKYDICCVLHDVHCCISGLFRIILSSWFLVAHQTARMLVGQTIRGVVCVYPGLYQG